MIAALSRRAALGALAAVVSAPAAIASEPDPIFAGIETVRATEAALTAALRGLDEDDAEQVRIADEAADRSGDAPLLEPVMGHRVEVKADITARWSPHVKVRQTRRDALGAYRIPAFAMPIPVHMQWCSAVAATDEEMAEMESPA